MTPRAECADCGIEYGGPQWVEAVVPDRVWNVIRPADSSEGGGLLCIGCIARRLRLIPGIGRVPVWLCGTEPLDAWGGDPGDWEVSFGVLRGWPHERGNIDMKALRMNVLWTMHICQGLAEVDGVPVSDMLSAAIDLKGRMGQGNDQQEV